MSSGLTSAALYAATISSPSALGPVPEHTQKKNHHVQGGKSFINPWDSHIDRSMMGMLYEAVRGKLDGSLANPDTTIHSVPIVTPSFHPTRTNTTLRATWLGHACYYVEFPSGLRVLFDPVFEDRCGPRGFGPKRFTPPPCQPSDIPIVDLVVISHSHYDHLSVPTILELHKKHPNVQFLVGLGLKQWFRDTGIENVVEMDWWNDVDVELSPISGEKRISTASDKSQTQPPSSDNPSSSIKARITCLPAQHASARTPFDKSVTLWASWAVESEGKSVWFAGDTGYRSVPRVPKGVDDYGPEYAHLPSCPAFKEIGDLRGPFDLGLIPIGAYDPRHLFSPMHANPYDSVNIFLDTKCKRAMAIHWGTWTLTAEPVMEPPELLKKALAWKNVPSTGVFDVCDIGESREF